MHNILTSNRRDYIDNKQAFFPFKPNKGIKYLNHSYCNRQNTDSGL